MASKRSKGETVTPANTLRLVGILGVTKAARMLGVSTTTLHKARKGNVVSKVVEIAAGGALENLGNQAPSRAPAPRRAAEPVNVARGASPSDFVPSDQRNAVFLIAVTPDKAEMVQSFARMLGAEIVSH